MFRPWVRYSDPLRCHPCLDGSCQPARSLADPATSCPPLLLRRLRAHRRDGVHDVGTDRCQTRCVRRQVTVDGDLGGWPLWIEEREDIGDLVGASLPSDWPMLT